MSVQTDDRLGLVAATTDHADVPAPADAGRAERSMLAALIRDPLALAAVVVLAVIVLCAIAPGVIATHSPTEVNTVESLQGPSADHPFGTDQFGRDVFSRVVHGARVSILAGLATTAFALVLGSLVGLISGFLGGLVDTVTMRVIDVLLAFPALLLALTVIAVRGRGTGNIVLALGIAMLPGYARLMRGEVLTIRRLPYIEAAQAAGTRTRTTVVTHVLPNAAPPVVVFATLGIGIAILATSSLSFLGLGPKPPTAEWGSMLAEGRVYLEQAGWIAMFPGAAIALTVVAINLLGQFVREHLDRVHS